jgi:hypothetical protein
VRGFIVLHSINHFFNNLKFNIMKTPALLSILASLLLMLNTISCTKENSSIETPLLNDQSIAQIQTNLLGSWTLIEKGVEIDQHNGQPCGFTGTKNPMIQWSNALADEKRAFTLNGGYSRYVNSTLTCEGTYKITYVGTIELTTNCQNAVETVQALTVNSLIVRDGMSFRKYSKVE